MNKQFIDAFNTGEYIIVLRGRSCAYASCTRSVSVLPGVYCEYDEYSQYFVVLGCR